MSMADQTALWCPFPDLKVRATDLGEDGLALEVWREQPAGTWGYTCLMPDAVYARHKAQFDPIDWPEGT